MRRTSTRTTAVLGAATALTLLAACGSAASDAGAEPDSDSPSAGTSTSPASPPSSTQHPSTQPPSMQRPHTAATPSFPSGIGERVAKNKGAWDLVLRDIRVAEHDGFDRLVAEFRGTGTPGWNVKYVKKPRAEGSGQPVAVDGENFLAVSISGVTLRKGYPQTSEDFYDGPRHFEPENAGDVEDVHLVGVFEGYSQLFLGLGGDKLPFRVFTLTKPSRLVIDVQDD